MLTETQRVDILGLIRRLEATRVSTLREAAARRVLHRIGKGPDQSALPPEFATSEPWDLSKMVEAVDRSLAAYWLYGIVPFDETIMAIVEALRKMGEIQLSLRLHATWRRHFPALTHSGKNTHQNDSELRG